MGGKNWLYEPSEWRDGGRQTNLLAREIQEHVSEVCVVAGGKLVCKNLETIQENICRKLAGVVQLQGLC